MGGQDLGEGALSHQKSQRGLTMRGLRGLQYVRTSRGAHIPRGFQGTGMTISLYLSLSVHTQGLTAAAPACVSVGETIGHCLPLNICMESGHTSRCCFFPCKRTHTGLAMVSQLCTHPCAERSLSHASSFNHVGWPHQDDFMPVAGIELYCRSFYAWVRTMTENNCEKQCQGNFCLLFQGPRLDFAVHTRPDIALST